MVGGAGDLVESILGPSAGGIVSVVGDVLGNVLAPIGNVVVFVGNLVSSILSPLGNLVALLGDVLGLIFGPFGSFLKTIVANVLTQLAPTVGAIVLAPVQSLLFWIIDTVFPF